MTRALSTLVSGILIVLMMSVPGLPHSLDYVEGKLAGKGDYFAFFDRKAPGFELQDARGNKVTAQSFAGKVVVLYFTKAGCAADCFAHTERLAEIQSMVNFSPMRDLVRFVAIIPDPGANPPDRVREYTARSRPDPLNWTFLTSGPGQPGVVRQLMQAFGHEAGKNADGTPARNAVTHVVDMKGRWRADFNGLEFQPLDLVLYVNALVNFGSGVKDGHAEGR